MILSDEPGYYEDGKFGIRIESLVKIVKAEPKYSSSGKKNKNNSNFYLNDILDAMAIVLHVLMIFTIIFDEASTLYFYGMMVDCLFVCLFSSIFLVYLYEYVLDTLYNSRVQVQFSWYICTNMYWILYTIVEFKYNILGIFVQICTRYFIQ